MCVYIYIYHLLGFGPTLSACEFSRNHYWALERDNGSYHSALEARLQGASMLWYWEVSFSIQAQRSPTTSREGVKGRERGDSGRGRGRQREREQQHGKKDTWTDKHEDR